MVILTPLWTVLRKVRLIIIPFPQRTVWHGPERVTQFGDGIVGAGEVRSSETDAPLNRPF